MRGSLFAVAFFLLGALAHAQETKATPKTITTTGQLQRIMAIGGETTGWALALAEPVQLESGPVKRLEIDPGRTHLEAFENRRVRLSGALERRQGVERGSYWVLVVDKIEPADREK